MHVQTMYNVGTTFDESEPWDKQTSVDGFYCEAATAHLKCWLFPMFASFWKMVNVPQIVTAFKWWSVIVQE